MTWPTRQPLLGRSKGAAVPDPTTSRRQQEAFAEYQQFLAMQRQNAAKGAGKTDGKAMGNKSKPVDKWSLPQWTCSFCQDTNLGRHSYCANHRCRLHFKDGSHWNEEELTGSKQSKGKGKDNLKGKGKGKAGKGKGTDSGDKVLPAAGEQSDDALATVKCLSAMGIHQAPQIEDMKPYPVPPTKSADSEMGTSAELKVQQLEASLADAEVKKFPACITSLLKKEIAAAKAEQAKTEKPAKVIQFEALKKRIANAELAASGALERHQAQVSALDGQIQQRQKIREHKILEFAKSQEAFAARKVEDEVLLAEMIAAAPVAQQVPQPAAEINTGVHNALADLQREYRGDVKAEVPRSLPDSNDQAKLSAMAALWHYYSAAGEFSSIPATTFDMLQVSPAFVHTLVGDTIWEGYWGCTHNQIQGSHYIPATMHLVLKYVLQEKHQELSVIATAKETARERIKAARAAATAIY